MALLAAALGVLASPLADIFIATLAGFVGCNIDSLLGSGVQVLYTCGSCGMMTEKRVHCGQRTKWVKGWSAVGNNEVNLLSDVVAVAVAFLASYL
jgi:uncharacterized membrane protein